MSDPGAEAPSSPPAETRANPPAAGRLYSDEEVALILRRALEPSAARSAAATSGDGVSLAQLEDIAGEAGIDLARVRQAAASLDLASPTATGSLVFGPRVSHVYDREVEGEVPPENMSAVVAAARRLTHSQGKVQEVGDWLEWQSDARIIHVSVKPENGKTKVQVMADGGFRAVAVFVPTAMATLIASVALGDAGAGAPVILGIVAGGITFARTAWEIMGRSARAKYDALAERLTHEISTLT